MLRVLALRYLPFIFYFNYFKNEHFWLCRVFVAAWAFLSCNEQQSLSSCGVWASNCSGSSCCGAQAL